VAIIYCDGNRPIRKSVLFPEVSIDEVPKRNDSVTIFSQSYPGLNNTVLRQSMLFAAYRVTGPFVEIRTGSPLIKINSCYRNNGKHYAYTYCKRKQERITVNFSGDSFPLNSED